MNWLRILLSRLAAVFHARNLDADLNEEMRAHIDLAIEEHEKRGLSKGEARRAALRAFGGVTQIKETYRVQRGVPLLAQAGRAVRYSIRQLRISPGFALTAILTLALCVGAVTSVFSVVSAVLLKPFAFGDPGGLLVMREMEDERRSERASIPVNYRHYQRLKRDSKTIEDAAIFQQPGLSVSPNGDRPQIVGGVAASPNFFRVLGVQPMLGRDFVESDAVEGATQVVVLSYKGWQNFFQGDTKVLGQTLRIGGEPATVIGVLPPGVLFPQVAMAEKIAVPSALETVIFGTMSPTNWDLTNDTGNYNFNVIARLRPGVTLAQATSELGTLQAAYTVTAKLPSHLGISLTPLAKDVASGISGALWLLFAAVSGVLLIACVNLANLQLARAVTAERETAIRSALGASRLQLVMARLVESLVLAVVGGAAGVALAFVGVRSLVAMVPANVPRLNEIQISFPVILFSAGLSIAAALAFGILPALRTLRVPPQTALQANSPRAVNSREGRRTRNVLVASQVACTVVLLVLTSLALRSFARLLRQDRGFDSSHITLAHVDLYAPQYGDKQKTLKAAKLAFADRALTALAALPGVQSVAFTSAVPLTGETWVDALTRPDHPVPEAHRPLVNLRFINADYLSTMQVPLVAGRNLNLADRANPYVALISERTAREGFPGENPIGKQMGDLVPNDEHQVTVVGVVADTRINGLRDSAAMIYLPYWAFTPWSISLMVRSSQPSAALIPEIRRTIWGIDPQVPIPSLKSMDDQVSDSVATDRFQAIVLTSFGTAALFLALLGIYGVLAYSVSRRQQEFGIRIALGSGKAALMQLVLRQAAFPVFLGASVGIVLSFVALHWVRRLLYQAPLLDPWAVGGSLLLLLVAAALAAALPARRAASVEPTQALRMD
jgi:predicted permease